LYEQLRDALVKTGGSDHPHTLSTLTSLAGAYQQVNKLPRAIELLEQVRDSVVKKLGADDPLTLTTLNKLGLGYHRAGKLPRAIEMYTQARTGLVKNLGADHPRTLTTTNNLAGAYYAAGNPEKALPLCLLAAEGIEKRNFLCPNAHTILHNLIACQGALKQYAAAEPWRRKALALARKQGGADTLAYATDLALLGRNLFQQHKWQDAEPVLRECLSLREKQAPDSWVTPNARSLLGVAHLGQGRYADAEPLLLDGYAGLKKHEAIMPRAARNCLTEALERLVQLYDSWGQPKKAARWRQELKTVGKQ
jgi:tetratricopeptide (TPR) repeat protein